jgi:drug/metabolite transporter (DMT)-like permease
MIGMTFLNPLCCVVAMNYASPSILAPFSGLTLVWIVLFAEMMIGERPRRTQVGAAGLIVLGEVVISVFGDHSNDENSTLDDVVRMLSKHNSGAPQLSFW